MSANDPVQSSSHSQPHPESVDPQSIEGVFLAALQKPTAEARAAYLDEACGDDQERRRRVAALLLAYEDAGSFLETPAGGPRLDRTQAEPRLDFLLPSDKPGCLGVLGPYEIIDVIGRGGMGIVLRALDPKLNRIVAVKVLAPELAANPNARKRFLREAQAAAAISHPHVVTIHAVEDGAADPGVGPSPYLVMEYVVGQSLQDKLDRVGSLGMTEILRISQQIASGLAAAHKQGLVHRDIKPANILLENGVERVKITDFGLARLTDDVAITRTGEVSGTPQYMSPEQAKGERVDHRSDLFSLGCVMYAMCTGHSPFRGDSLAHVIQRVTQDEPRAIEDQNAEVPPWLVEIVQQLLEKSPDHRFQSAEEVAGLLGAHLARLQLPAPGRTSHGGINRRAFEHRRPARSVAARGMRRARTVELPQWANTAGLCLMIAGAAVIVVGVGANVASLFSETLGPATADRAWFAACGLFPLVAGALLRQRHVSTEAQLLILFVLLGPLGVVIWLLMKDRWDRAVPTDDDLDRSDEAASQAPPQWLMRLRMLGNCLLIASAATLLCPLLAIGFGLLTGDGDPMEFGGSLLAWLWPLIAVALVLGAALRIATWVFDPTPCTSVPEAKGVLEDQPARRLSPAPPSADIVQAVRGPARALAATAMVNWIAYIAIGLVFAMKPDLLPADSAAPLAIFAGLVLSIGSGLIWRGAWSLHSLQANRWAMTAAVCALFIGPGYIIGWPAGLWTISLLARDEVRESFTDRSGVWWIAPGAFFGLILAFLAALVLASQGTMAFTPGNVAEALTILSAAVIVFGAPLTILWLLVRPKEGDARSFPERMQAALGQPGKILAWLGIGIACMLLVAPCLIGVGLIAPYLLSHQGTARVAISYPADSPIVRITTAQGVQAVHSLPHMMTLPPGDRLLRIQYEYEGGLYQFEKTLKIEPEALGHTIQKDFTTEILHHRQTHAGGGGDELYQGGEAFEPGDSAHPEAGGSIPVLGRPAPRVPPQPAPAPEEVPQPAPPGVKGEAERDDE